MDAVEHWAEAVIAVGVRRAGHPAVQTIRFNAQGQPVPFAGIYGTAFVVDSSAAVALPDEPMPLSASTDTV